MFKSMAFVLDSIKALNLLFAAPPTLLDNFNEDVKMYEINVGLSFFKFAKFNK